MQLLVAQHDALEGQIALAGARVAGMLDREISRRLQTMTGCGPAIAATLSS